MDSFKENLPKIAFGAVALAGAIYVLTSTKKEKTERLITEEDEEVALNNFLDQNLPQDQLDEKIWEWATE